MAKSVIENLPEKERQKVIDALLAGESLRKVAGKVGVSHVAVQNYKRLVLKPALHNATKLNEVLRLTSDPVEKIQENVALTRAALAADPILERIAEHRKTVDSKLAAAGAQGAAALINADLKGLDLEARLTGRLDSSQGSQALTIVAGDVYIQQQPEPPARGVTLDLTTEK